MQSLNYICWLPCSGWTMLQRRCLQGIRMQTSTNQQQESVINNNNTNNNDDDYNERATLWAVLDPMTVTICRRLLSVTASLPTKLLLHSWCIAHHDTLFDKSRRSLSKPSGVKMCVDPAAQSTTSKVTGRHRGPKWKLWAGYTAPSL